MAIDIAVFTDLDAVAADAGDALDRHHQPSLFDRLDWYRLLVAHCPLPGTPLILRARDEGGTAWLFLMHERGRATAMANWYSFETGLVTFGTARLALAEALARRLRIINRFAAIELAPLSSRHATAMAQAFRKAGWIAMPRQTTVNWILESPSSDWNSYLSTRPGALRSTLRRKSKYSNLSIDIHNVFSEVNWRAYEQVYAKSWKPEEGSPAFLRALARQESEAGTLRLGLAFEGDQPVAAQFWLVENGIATIHKLAHVETITGHTPDRRHGPPCDRTGRGRPDRFRHGR